MRIVYDFLQYACQRAACSTEICHIAHVDHPFNLSLGGLVVGVVAQITKNPGSIPAWDIYFPIYFLVFKDFQRQGTYMVELTVSFFI